MIYLLGFLLTILVVVLVHEYGHYRVAVACDVKVLRFSLGFGRVLWRRRRGDTEFALSVIPMGGYVKMLDEREEPVARHELHRAFNRKSVPQRAAIILAGPFANLVLAVLLFAALGWVGTEEPRPILAAPAAGSVAERAGLRAGELVVGVSDDGREWRDVHSMNTLRWLATLAALEGRDLHLQVTGLHGGGVRDVYLPLQALDVRDIDAQTLTRIGIGVPWQDAVIVEVRPDGPAARAGLQAGDRILRIDGQPVGDRNSAVAAIRASVVEGKTREQPWEIRRGDQLLSLNVTPEAVHEQGQWFGRAQAGIGSMPLTTLVRLGPVDGFVAGVQRTWQTSVLSLRLLWRMVTLQASVKNLSGPLTIADVAGQTLQRGFGYYVEVLAVVSLGLAVINLLPVPLLDGGQLMYHLFEGVTGRPLSDLWIDRLQRSGLVIVVLMMSLALYNDVARLIGFQ